MEIIGGAETSRSSFINITYLRILQMTITFLNNRNILKVATKMFPVLTKSCYFVKPFSQAVTGKHTEEEGKKKKQNEHVCSIEVLWPYGVALHLAPRTILSSFAFQICTSLLNLFPMASQKIPVSLWFFIDDGISLV